MQNSEFGKKETWTEKLSERDRNQKWLNDRLFDLDFSTLYLGDEMNTHHFDWDQAVLTGHIGESFRICLANMMGNNVTYTSPAMPLFYELLHAYNRSWVVERTLCPPTRRNQLLMKEDGIAPFAVESKMPLSAFDCLCLSKDLTRSAAAIPWIILEAGIPVFSRDRENTDPFVILGGSALINPGPFQHFCDIMFFGEGEEVLPELLSLLAEGRRDGLPRESILLDAARRWDCIYVPRFYEERFDEKGNFKGTFPLRSDVPRRIQFYRVRDLDQVYVATSPFEDFGTRPVDTAHYEISRGCEGKCSFCMGGFTTLPFRTRSADRIQQIVDEIVQNTGNISVEPVSFNSVSHPQINQIIRRFNDSLGDRVKLVSMRMDGFSSNPELCCFISMQERGRIAFGVEGASQRLRDLVSKNLSEDQILETMHQVCRNGYRTVKFMMIAGLPTESPDDLEELYRLAVKIRAIFEEETGTGGTIPHLLFSWSLMLVGPHTPLQWAHVPESLPDDYAEFERKVRGLGFRSTMPQISPEYIMTQLFLRGDGRLTDLLLYLAEEGELHHSCSYGQETMDKALRFLEEHHLPPLAYWFRECRLEDPLPWDIVDSPAAKAYLWRRYMAMKENAPVSEPVCSTCCSGCGSCDPRQQKILRGLSSLREEDRKIDLHHPVRKTKYKAVQYVLVEYDYDRLHSGVIPGYWDCELRRALFKAGVSFDPDSVESFGSDDFGAHAAAGFNTTCISLCRQYDLNELRALIEAHALNFHVRQILEIPRPVRVREVTYRMRVPQGKNPEQLNEQLRKRLEEEDWIYLVSTGLTYKLTLHLRSSVKELKAEGDDLMISMGPVFADPRKVYRCLFDIPDEEPLCQMPERISVVYENQGILDHCLNRSLRDDFLQYRGSKPGHDKRSYNEMVNYISSASCVKDMKNLIGRNYRLVPPPFHYRVPKNLSGRKRDVYSWKGTFGYLLKLTAFALREYDGIFSDGLYSFRTSRTAQDFLRILRDSEKRSGCYIVKADVSAYVGSIVPEKIIPMLESLWAEDPALLDLMKYILLRRECVEADGETVVCEPGGLGGIPLANVFMNVYLMELDDYFYPRAQLYCRYSDDIIIFARSRDEALEFYDHLLQVLKEKKLGTNTNKTYLIEPGGEVEILGCKLKDGRMDISDHAKQKLKRKIRMRANKLMARRKQGLTDEECGRLMAGYCNRIFFGQNKANELTWARWLFPIITETSSLKELDHFIQDAIRRCMSGSSRRKRYNISYKELKAAGYRSLVHAYYHFETSPDHIDSANAY